MDRPRGRRAGEATCARERMVSVRVDSTAAATRIVLGDESRRRQSRPARPRRYLECLAAAPENARLLVGLGAAAHDRGRFLEAKAAFGRAAVPPPSGTRRDAKTVFDSLLRHSCAGIARVPTLQTRARAHLGYLVGARRRAGGRMRETRPGGARGELALAHGRGRAAKRVFCASGRGRARRRAGTKRCEDGSRRAYSAETSRGIVAAAAAWTT